jgi:hypothetical protein
MKSFKKLLFRKMFRIPLFRFGLALLLYVALDHFCDLVTKGFRYHEILSDQPNNAKWEIPPLTAKDEEAIYNLLNQPFYFLGGGQQCYAFLSQDGQTVLKFFRHDHRSPKNILTHIKLPSLFDSYRQKMLNYKSRKNLTPLFQSYKLAYDNLKEQSGLLYLHLNKTQGKFPKTTLFDAIGAKHEIDLDSTEFVLQQKAELIFPTFLTLIAHGELKAVQSSIHALFLNLAARCDLGIKDQDTAFKRNIGFIDERPIFFDVGNLWEDPHLKDPVLRKNEIAIKTQRLQRWLRAHCPELLPIYEEELAAL